MEKHLIFNKIRASPFNTLAELKGSFPELACLIASLLSKEPEKRPTCSQVLACCADIIGELRKVCCKDIRGNKQISGNKTDDLLHCKGWDFFVLSEGEFSLRSPNWSKKLIKVMNNRLLIFTSKFSIKAEVIIDLIECCIKFNPEKDFKSDKSLHQISLGNFEMHSQMVCKERTEVFIQPEKERSKRYRSVSKSLLERKNGIIEIIHPYLQNYYLKAADKHYSKEMVESFKESILI